MFRKQLVITFLAIPLLLTSLICLGMENKSHTFGNYWVKVPPTQGFRKCILDNVTEGAYFLEKTRLDEEMGDKKHSHLGINNRVMSALFNYHRYTSGSGVSFPFEMLVLLMHRPIMECAFKNSSDALKDLEDGGIVERVGKNSSTGRM